MRKMSHQESPILSVHLCVVVFERERERESKEVKMRPGQCPECSQCVLFE